MLKRIAPLVILLVAVAVSAWGREGFGFTKKSVHLQKTKPPAINITGTRVNVAVDTERTRISGQAKVLRDSTEQAILAGNKDLQAAPQGDVNLTLALDRLDADQHLESKTEYESEKTKDKNGKTSYVSVPKTKNFTHVSGAIGGTYKITDAKGRLLDSGDFDRKWEEDYDYSPPSNEKVESTLLQFAANTIAARIVPTKERANVLLPKGSFESFIPLAESGAWDKYLQGVESVRPMNDRSADAYRQYALGVAKEALAYGESDPKKGLELLRAAAEHYRTAAADNGNEKLFSEAYTSLFNAAAAPVARAEASVKAYEAWTSGPTAPMASSASSTTTRPSTPSKTSGMRNQNVIDMAKAGLSDENIIMAIDAADSPEFDSSPDGLIALSKAGVSKNVITHIQKRARK
jgi:hypothetical protein